MDSLRRQRCPTVKDHDDWCMCIDCRIEQAEHDVLRDMNIVEELKKEKEQENANS